jgi:hypothetical protein
MDSSVRRFIIVPFDLFGLSSCEGRSTNLAKVLGKVVKRNLLFGCKVLKSIQELLKVDASSALSLDLSKDQIDISGSESLVKHFAVLGNLH